MVVVDPLGGAEVLDADRADCPLDEVGVLEDPTSGVFDPDPTGHVPGVQGEHQRALQPLRRRERGEVARHRDGGDRTVLLERVLPVGVGVDDDALVTRARAGSP